MTSQQIQEIIAKQSIYSSVIKFDSFNKYMTVTQSADINITLSGSGNLDNANCSLIIIPDNVHALTIDSSAFNVSGALDTTQVNMLFFYNPGAGIPPMVRIVNYPRPVVDYTRSFQTSNSSANVITLANTDTLLSFLSDVPFTVMFWVKTLTGSIENNVLVRGDGSNDVYVIAVDALNKFSFLLRDTGSNYIYTKIGTALSTNTWYHLAVTYDGSKDYTGVKMYLNGVNSSIENSSSGTFGTIKNTGTVKIGNRPSTGSYGNFKIDHLAVANVALSSSQILEAYNMGVATNLNFTSFSPNLLAYYVFFNNLNDISVNGTHTGSSSSTTYSTDTP